MLPIVDGQEIITALSGGTVEISATLKDGMLMATYKINVSQDICKGDVNGDGEVTIKDQMIFAYVSGTTELTNVQIQVADVNEDGKVTAKNKR